MFKIDHKKAQAIAKAGQAAIELAVFGAILIFILGTIVRSAVGNGYSQNQNFKAMRMAMLASWHGTVSHPGKQAQNTSHNSASILFVEDRLSPDFNKYGNLDRSPFIVQGSGTFSYNLQYPFTDTQDILASLPVMDVYINGQHFPFTTASYVSRTITRPACDLGGPYPPGGLTQAQCLQNQCLRNAREWAGGIVNESQFDNIIPVTTFDGNTSQTIESNASTIFNALVTGGVITNVTGTDLTQNVPGNINGLSANTTSLVSSGSLISSLAAKLPSLSQAQLNQVQSILQSNMFQYKLFYTMVANGMAEFSPLPPGSCSGTNNALCSTLTMNGINGPYTNNNPPGDMQYDLSRNGDYPAVEAQFPSSVTACSDVSVLQNMRCYVAWQWAASPATSAQAIGLNISNNQYPTYDIDGRLKEVVVYGFNLNPDGTPNVTYEDFQGGDIDVTWDHASCGPKPGLQNNSQIYTFTKQGTYLQIKEGKLFNPETDQFVRSANKRDTIDLIQRTVQLSNNTGRFCDQNGNLLSTVANDGATPNPVEVCIPPGSGDNCFSNEQNIKSTCYDENSNRIFVRSRLEDRRGHFWMTDTSGQLSIK